MFKSKAKERRMFTSRKRSRRRRYSGFSAIASVALFLLVLELLTRIFIDISGNRSKFAQAKTESDITQAYRLQFIAEEPTVNQKTDNKNNLLTAKKSLSVGYQLLGNQKHKYWQLNEQGFRDHNIVPLAKPQNEIRIFLIGGSTAFGYGNPGNASTISEHLEARLQKRLHQQKSSPLLYKPDLLPFNKKEKQKHLAKHSKIKPGNYRIINAAVPGYASGNELAQVALQILQYKPDLIVILDGYEDLMLPSDQEATEIPQLKQYLENQPTGVANYLSQVIEPLEKKSYLAKVAQNRWLNPQKATEKADFLLNEQTSRLVQHLPPDEDELQKRVNRYIEHQKQILNLSAAAQIPLVVAIQPEITGRNPSQLTDTEGKIATELGRTYIKQVKASYPALINATQELAQAFPKNMKVVDLYKLTDKYPSPSFIDAIHLNEAANQKVAEQLYYAITGLPKMQVIPTQAKPPKPK